MHPTFRALRPSWLGKFSATSRQTFPSELGERTEGRMHLALRIDLDGYAELDDPTPHVGVHLGSRIFIYSAPSLTNASTRLRSPGES